MCRSLSISVSVSVCKICVDLQRAHQHVMCLCFRYVRASDLQYAQNQGQCVYQF